MSDNEKKKGPPIKEDPNVKYNPVVIGVLTDTAIGLSRLPNGKFVIATILYNPVTLETGKPEIKELMNGSNDSEYDFRDLVENYLEDFNNNLDKKKE